MNVYSRITNIGNNQGSALPLLCPGCSRVGTFSPLGQDLAFTFQPKSQPPVPQMRIGVGHRQCPDPHCGTHVFVVYEALAQTKLVCAYPVGRIDFDSANVPDKVRRAFDEALTCQANECYVAAGMLIRKTLEAVCTERNAKGESLKVRIGDLRSKVTLPNELFEAMDHLRLLGNDAAHIDAKNYDEVGKEEISTSIELAKEIIKATYQYKGLLGKLLALKKA